jgi:hypothetical protein
MIGKFEAGVITVLTVLAIAVPTVQLVGCALMR